jgi:anti-sigma B factor antagonist
VDLKLGHYGKDGIEVIDVQGEIDIYTAPRLRELLIDLVSTGSYQLVVNLDKVGFLDSTGLGVLVGGLRRVRAHDGSLDLGTVRLVSRGTRDCGEPAQLP